MSFDFETSNSQAQEEEEEVNMLSLYCWFICCNASGRYGGNHHLLCQWRMVYYYLEFGLEIIKPNLLGPIFTSQATIALLWCRQSLAVEQPAAQVCGTAGPFISALPIGHTTDWMSMWVG